LFPTSATKPDVRVGIRRSIVQIQRKNAAIRRIVPIATPFEGFLRYPYF